MKSFNQLKKNLKKATSLPTTKVALLGDSATQLLTMAVKGHGVDEGIDFDVFESDYNQIEQQVFNQESQLYQHQPAFVILCPSTEMLLTKYNKSAKNQRNDFATLEIQRWIDIYEAITSNSQAKVILFNFPLINDGVFGNYANKVKDSFLFQLRKLNVSLMNQAVEKSNLFIYDLDILQSQLGHLKRFPTKFYYSAKMTFAIEVLPRISKELTDIILAVKGVKLRKCLILDLDNTMWGGVIGDDGMEKIQIGSLGLGKAFTELQQWALELKKRGIILCVCSKNTESIAKEPFEQHPEMVLRLEDISVFVANWENKADNIRHIKTVLNIGYDSMVFLDDNPFERNLVRTELPEVAVPELPEDPSDYMNFIRAQNLFETASLSKEDDKRTQRYQEEAKRLSNKKTFNSIEGYLESLNMVAESEPFNSFSIPRVAQLTQRSNQFNLRTIRYSDEDIQKITSSEDYLTNQIKLKDKYGEYGLISLVIGKKEGTEVFIDTWIMSCRVLKRDVEKFVLNELVKASLDAGAERLVGEYLPTRKNVIVKDHYPNLGFEEKDGLWVLNLKTYQPKSTFIFKNEPNLA